jgi:hypothetical protein
MTEIHIAASTGRKGVLLSRTALRPTEGISTDSALRSVAVAVAMRVPTVVR